MSNKKRLSKEECQKRKDAHLDRTIKELGYEEITQRDYRILKREDPAHYHSYTIRFKHKYYKMSWWRRDEEDKVIESLKLEIMKSARDYFQECIKKMEHNDYGTEL